MRATTFDRLVPLAWIGVGALSLWLAFGHGFANYDTFYALVWGDELAGGDGPDYDAALSPTPHPLATLFGLLVSPFGDGAETAAVVVAFLSLGAIGYLVFRLGEHWLNPWVGGLAAAIVLTREPIVDYGSRAYVDLPYIALVLAALLVEARAPRQRAESVLVLLGLAGLLRPEAWLFAGAYLLYLVFSLPRRPPGLVAPLALLFRRGALLRATLIAAAAPLLWLLFDLVFAGDPLYSLTGTQDTVETLKRDTGLADAIRLAPRRLGEIMREPVLLGAVGGVVFCLALLRRRSALIAGAGAIALAAFFVLATAGLAVITRYLLLAGVFGALFGAAGALGWLSLERTNPWRRWWAGFGVVVIVALVAFGPRQAERLDDLRDSVAAGEQIRDDLDAVANAPLVNQDCEQLAVPSTQAVPMLALWFGVRPSEISTSPDPAAASSGYLFTPVSPEIAERFALDENDPAGSEIFVPPELAPVASDASWVVYGICS